METTMTVHVVGETNAWVQNVPTWITSASMLYEVLEDHRNDPVVAKFLALSKGSVGGWWTGGGRNFVSIDLA